MKNQVKIPDNCYRREFQTTQHNTAGNNIAEALTDRIIKKWFNKAWERDYTPDVIDVIRNDKSLNKWGDHYHDSFAILHRVCGSFAYDYEEILKYHIDLNNLGNTPSYRDLYFAMFD